MAQATNDRQADFATVHRELEEAIKHLKEAHQVLHTSAYWSSTTECRDISVLIKTASSLSRDFNV